MLNVFTVGFPVQRLSKHPQPLITWWKATCLQTVTARLRLTGVTLRLRNRQIVVANLITFFCKQTADWLCLTAIFSPSWDSKVKIGTDDERSQSGSRPKGEHFRRNDITAHGHSYSDCNSCCDCCNVFLSQWVEISLQLLAEKWSQCRIALNLHCYW